MTITTPLLIINCKTYGSKPDELALALAQSSAELNRVRRAQGKKSVCIALAVSATNLFQTSSKALVPIFAQHLDPQEPGAHTGKILTEDIKANGAVGSLINHSEDPSDDKMIAENIARLKSAGLTSVVCAKDAPTAARLAAFGPDYIAMEPPELIGGPVSVSNAKPEVITQTIEAVSAVADIPVLVGAGVKTTEDVAIGVKLGAQGILVASGVTKASDFVSAIEELANGFD